MDERYAPAYYTDVDLALALRARGMRVLCEPASVVEHWRGTSSTLRFAQFVSGHNREKLLAKWGDAVMSHEPGSGSAVSRGEAAVPAQDCRRDRRARIRRRRCATSTAPGLSSAQSTTGSSRSRRGCPGSNGAPRCSRTSKAEAGGGCAAASCPPCVPPPPRDAPRSGSCSAAPDRPVEVDLRAVVAVDAFQMHPQPLIIPGEVTAHSQSTTVDTS